MTEPNPNPPPPPTLTELKALAEAAVGGSKAAQEKLEQLAKEHTGLAARILELEKKIAEKKPEEIPAPLPDAKPWFWR